MSQHDACHELIYLKQVSRPDLHTVAYYSMVWDCISWYATLQYQYQTRHTWMYCDLPVHTSMYPVYHGILKFTGICCAIHVHTGITIKSWYIIVYHGILLLSVGPVKLICPLLVFAVLNQQLGCFKFFATTQTGHSPVSFRQVNVLSKYNQWQISLYVSVHTGTFCYGMYLTVLRNQALLVCTILDWDILVNTSTYFHLQVQNILKPRIQAHDLLHTTLLLWLLLGKCWCE